MGADSLRDNKPDGRPDAPCEQWKVVADMDFEINATQHAVSGRISSISRTHAAGVSNAGLPLMPVVVPTWRDDVRVPTNRSVTATPTNVAALAKQGAPPPGEPR